MTSKVILVTGGGGVGKTTLSAALAVTAARSGVRTLVVTIDPAAADRIHPNDLRRIERALEVHHLGGVPISELQKQWAQSCSKYDCRVAALRRSKEETNRRINARAGRMIEAGLVEEVRSLLAEPAGIGDQAAQAVGYAEVIHHLQGESSGQPLQHYG